MVCHLNVLITYSETTWGAIQLWCSICTGFLSFCKEVRVQGFMLVDEASIYTASGYTSVKYQVICDYSCRKERSSSLLATHTQKYLHLAVTISVWWEVVGIWQHHIGAGWSFVPFAEGASLGWEKPSGCSSGFYLLSLSWDSIVGKPLVSLKLDF